VFRRRKVLPRRHVGCPFASDAQTLPPLFPVFPAAPPREDFSSLIFLRHCSFSSDMAQCLTVGLFFVHYNSLSVLSRASSVAHPFFPQWSPLATFSPFDILLSLHMSKDSHFRFLSLTSVCSLNLPTRHLVDVLSSSRVIVPRSTWISQL